MAPIYYLYQFSFGHKVTLTLMVIKTWKDVIDKRIHEEKKFRILTDKGEVVINPEFIQYMICKEVDDTYNVEKGIYEDLQKTGATFVHV